MTDIRLNDEQAQILATATDEVLFWDAKGNVVKRVSPELPSDEQAIIAEAERRLASDQPRYETAEVLDHLDALKQFESSVQLSQEEILACSREARALPLDDQNEPDSERLAAMARKYGVSVADIRSLIPQPMRH